jgi:homoserine kinase
MPIFTVTVPATTGNLGPGFDCLGAALSIFNRFEFSESDEFKIAASGIGADKVAKNKSNLVYQSFEKLYEKIGKPKPVICLNIQAQVFLSRGLGSSATAIVGGLVGGNLLAGEPLSVKEILQLAVEIEGHPDNVAPAMLGGCQLISTTKTNNWEYCNIAWHKKIAIALAIPDFELSTTKARQVLPKQVSLKDAIFNASHLALLTQALATANGAFLETALQDKLHQPYRLGLIPNMEEVQKAAQQAGAYGSVISGAGPTLLALGSPEKIEAIAEAMVSTWQSFGINAIKEVVAIAHEGTTHKQD